MSYLNVVRDASTGLTASVEARKQTPTGNALNVQIGPGDIISNIPVVLDFEHHQVHEGETHKASYSGLALGTGVYKFAIVVPTFATTINGPHMVASVDCFNGTVKVDVYEGATYTGGASMTSYNRNRNSATTPATTCFSGVTSTNGTLLPCSFYAGAGGEKTAGSTRAASEILLKSNTTYRVDVTGQAGTNADFIVCFTWYEDLSV